VYTESDWDFLLRLRGEANIQLEALRQQAIIGKASGATLLITYNGKLPQSFAATDRKLIRELTHTTSVDIVHNPDEAEGIEVRAIPIDDKYVECARCQNFHTNRYNADFLCDRCVRVMIQNFPNHERIAKIRMYLAAQRVYFNKDNYRPTGKHLREFSDIVAQLSQLEI
jgi:hypothetical protein